MVGQLLARKMPVMNNIQAITLSYGHHNAR